VISTADFHKRFYVSIQFLRCHRQTYLIQVVFLNTLLESFNNCTSLFKLPHFIECEGQKQQELSYRSLTFSRRSTTKCTTKPVGKILNKLAIVFKAFCSFIYSESPISAKWKPMSTLLRSPICQHWRMYSIPLFPPSGLVSEHEQIWRQKLRMRPTGCLWFSDIRSLLLPELSV